MPRYRFPARFQYLDEVRSRVAETAHAAGFSDRSIYALQLAADEAASNIIEHAYGGESDEAWFEMDLDIQHDRLVLAFTDQGKSFDFSTVQKPDVKADLSDRKIGGLGVYLMQKLMDEVHYRSSGSQNVLTLTKRKP